MPQEVAKFLDIFKPIATNNRQIQDIKSEMCGWYCIALDYFLTYDRRSKDYLEEYDDFLNIWSADTKKNDRILGDYLRKNTIK
jgi:hypothetical protein